MNQERRVWIYGTAVAEFSIAWRLRYTVNNIRRQYRPRSYERGIHACCYSSTGVNNDFRGRGDGV